MERLLITGGSGYLGRYLSTKAAESFELFTTYHTQASRITAGRPLALDLTQREEVLRLITDLAPQAIIHTAALNPGQNPEQMGQINEQGSRYVAEGAMAVGARLIHISSDVVHDGQNAPYADDAPPSPLNTYSHSKAEAEAAVAEIVPSAVIVRTSLIYGLTEMDRGTEGLARQLPKKGDQPLTLFNDVLRQPIWVTTLSKALLKLVHLQFSGWLNIAGRQILTREAFVRRMFDWWQVKYQDRVQSGQAADISDTIPLDLRLVLDKGEQLLKMRFLGVDEVLTKHQT